MTHSRELIVALARSVLILLRTARTQEEAALDVADLILGMLDAGVDVSVEMSLHRLARIRRVQISAVREAARRR